MVLLNFWGTQALDTDTDKEELKKRVKLFLFENNTQFLTNYRRAKKAAKEGNYVEEMVTALKKIVNEVMTETPSMEFIKLNAGGLSSLYASTVKTEEGTTEVESITGTGKKTGETEELKTKKTVRDKAKIDRMLSRKKAIDLIENSDFVSTLSGITFTKYGRDLQSIKKFGKTYEQMFGEEWYDLETQFDVVTKKDTYAITPQRPLQKHAIIVVPDSANLGIETKAKNDKIRADGITNGRFMTQSGAFQKGRKEEVPISIELPELKGIREKDQKHITYKEVDGNEILEPETEEETAEISQAYLDYQEKNKDKLLTLEYKYVTNPEAQSLSGEDYKWTEFKRDDYSEEEFEDIVDDTAGGLADYNIVDDKRQLFEYKGKQYKLISSSGTQVSKFKEDVLNFDDVFEPEIKKWIDTSDIFDAAKLNLKDPEQVWQHKIELSIKSPPKKFKMDGEGLYDYLKDATLVVQYYARKTKAFEFNPYLRGGGAKSVNEELRRHVASFTLRYNKLKRMGIAGE